jgi:hypothetical protein
MRKTVPEADPTFRTWKGGNKNGIFRVLTQLRPGNTMTATLYTQSLVLASASTKIRLSILSVAVVDALGGPAEFRSRFSFPLITRMIPNSSFGLPPSGLTIHL